MASRLRLFVKKRGQRRTGPRWFGTFGIAVLHAALVAIGAAGLYWVIDRMLLAEAASQAWWLWFVLLIPTALVVYGLAGLAVLAWENVASSERRAAVVQMASEWDLPGVPAPTRPSLPAVPPIDAVVDSPGVRLKYRLPIDAAPSQLSIALAIVCVVLNTLVIGFVYQVIEQYVDGHGNPLLLSLTVPFLFAGIWTVFALVQQLLLTAGIGPTLIEVSDHPLYPGRRYEAFVTQAGRLHVRWYQVQLICQEQATYHQGTDTRTATAVVHRETVFSDRKFDISPAAAFEAQFSFAVPSDAMHSFEAAHNAVSWALVVRGRMARWPEFERRFPLYVYPVPASHAASAPQPQTVEGSAT
jgi:hypothetical protein